MTAMLTDELKAAIREEVARQLDAREAEAREDLKKLQGWLDQGRKAGLVGLNQLAEGSRLALGGPIIEHAHPKDAL